MYSVAESFSIKVSDVTAAGEVRRRAAALAEVLGFNETDQGVVSVIAAEVAKNIAIHSGDGEVILRELSHADNPGIELLALDKGRGIDDVPRAMRDGFSTAGTSGNGLGAMARMSSVFDLYSAPGNGTAVLAQYWPRATKPQTLNRLEFGVVQVPKTGEEVCGDAFTICQIDADHTLLMVADGLGHGPMARLASSEAVRIVRENSSTTMERLLELMHAALRPTRGAAASIAQFDLQAREIRFAGVGNVSGTIVGSESTKSMAAHNGTLGHSLLRVHSFTYPWPADGVLVMFSDGLGTQWKMEKYPGLSRKHPALIAGVLYRDFNRGRDDVTVVAVRDQAGGSRS
jgi:anti-sigma regulatory factor (Ser/Thr protein kinase)/serine/threonine protein phosphatase PrpC